MVNQATIMTKSGRPISPGGADDRDVSGPLADSPRGWSAEPLCHMTADDVGDQLHRSQRAEEDRQLRDQPIGLVCDHVQPVCPPAAQRGLEQHDARAASTISSVSSNGVRPRVSAPNRKLAVSLPRSGSSWTATRMVTSSLSDATIAAWSKTAVEHLCGFAAYQAAVEPWCQRSRCAVCASVVCECGVSATACLRNVAARVTVSPMVRPAS